MCKYQENFLYVLNSMLIMVFIGYVKNRKFNFNLNNLTRHAVVLGTTGSGKTVMAKVLIEEAMMKGIPVIAIDPKGDIGSVGITDDDFDFRPFCSKATATRMASKYHEASDTSGISSMKKNKVTIYTPKSNAGKEISFIPDLKAPENFKKMIEDDHNLLSDFIEPVSASVLQLAGISGSKQDIFQSFIAAIIENSWIRGKDLDIGKLIKLILKPDLKEIGSLPTDDFITKKERSKLASSINLILTSPAKRAWQNGDPIDVKNMLKKKNVSVFDLRFVSNNDEKQFVAEQIMQELYKFLTRRGGSQKLRFILYIDELAGLLPPPPASPPSKKLLELLIRQARAFGLGIILATQNPGDVDYRVFGNIGSRFIGRLRTTRDLEKVAAAMDIQVSILKKEASKLKTGDFVFNDAVKNTFAVLHARWLKSFHRGPLKKEEIAWVNDGSAPKPEEKLSIKKSEKKRPDIKKERSKHQTKKDPAKKKTKTKPLKSYLQKIKNQISKRADKLTVKISGRKADVFKPHLKIVVEPKKTIDISARIQGPYLFDLSSKSIPEGNYLRGISWRTIIPKDVIVEKNNFSIRAAFDYAYRDAKANLRTAYYSSTISDYINTDRDHVENRNYNIMMQTARPRIRKIKDDLKKKISDMEMKIRSENRKIRNNRSKVRTLKTRRMLRKIFAGAKLKKTPKEVLDREKIISRSKRNIERYKKQISRLRDEAEYRIQKLKDKAYKKAHVCVKKRVYRPSKKDLRFHATLFLK